MHIHLDGIIKVGDPPTNGPLSVSDEMMQCTTSQDVLQMSAWRLVFIFAASACLTPLWAAPPPPPPHPPSPPTVNPQATIPSSTRPPSHLAKVTPTTNVSIMESSIVDLSCSVATDSRAAVIVWLQSEHFKVLFYGSNRVTDDKRMSVRILVEEGVTKSTLRIEPVKRADEGLFICRVPWKDQIHTEVIQLTVRTVNGVSVPTEKLSSPMGARRDSNGTLSTFAVDS